MPSQTALPADGRARGSEGGSRAHERRDYAALAALAGYGREQYERLDPRGRRAARLEIDRELGLRRELNESLRRKGEGSKPGPRAERRSPRPEDERDAALRRPMSDRGRPTPESSVMRDVREVEAGRKRQLGRDRS